MKPTPIIAGNWKMYKTTQEASAFVRDLNTKLSTVPKASLPKVVICPPFTSLATVIETVAALNVPCSVGAQNMESREEGAYTGEISPLMLKDIKASYVIIGHSERRQYYNETDATVNEKTKAAFKHGLTPIVCVGETLAQREAGQTDAVIREQVTKATNGLTPANFDSVVFAYEPVWAIGTGRVCDSQEANRVCANIRRIVQETQASGNGVNVAGIPVLYGGSVKPDNAQELLGQSDINGALVGGAALQADSFFQIIQAGAVVTA